MLTRALRRLVNTQVVRQAAFKVPGAERISEFVKSRKARNHSRKTVERAVDNLDGIMTMLSPDSKEFKSIMVLIEVARNI